MAVAAGNPRWLRFGALPAVPLLLWALASCRPAPPGSGAAGLAAAAGPRPAGCCSVVLRPVVSQADRRAQSIVLKAIDRLERLDIVPYREVASNVFKPLLAATGEATTLDDAGVLKVSLSSADLAKPVKIGGLHANTRYRIFGHAYDGQGALLSTLDGQSYLDISVGTDDLLNPGIPLPVQLVATPFGARVRIPAVLTGAGAQVERVRLKLHALGNGGVEIPIAGAEQVVAREQLPHTFGVTNLQASASYRVWAHALGASDAPILATQSIDIPVSGLDDELPGLLNLTLSIAAGPTYTLAGSASSGWADGTGAAASFSSLYGLAVDSVGNVYVTDAYWIRKITPRGVVTKLAGSSDGFTNGTGNTAAFSSPAGLALDRMGRIYVADTGNNAIRCVTSSGKVTTVAGTGAYGFSNGSAQSATFLGPEGLAVDSAGNIFVADSGNDSIRKISPSGQVTTLAGGGRPGYRDDVGTAARFNGPHSLAIDASGDIFVADTHNRLIRKVTPSGVVSTVAGSGAEGVLDGVAANASFVAPWGLAFDRHGNLFISDLWSHVIRVLSPDGEVSTLAGGELGGARSGGGFADGIGAWAKFYKPIGLAVDLADHVYVADSANFRVRKIGAPPVGQGPAAPQVPAARPDPEGISFGAMPDPPRAARVRVVGITPTAVDPGKEATVEAIAYTSGGEQLDTVFTWTVSSDDLGWMEPLTKSRLAYRPWYNLFPDQGPGPVTLTARSGDGATGSITLTVNNLPPRILSKDVDPVAAGSRTSASVTINRSTSVRFTLVYQDPNGRSIPDPEGSRYLVSLTGPWEDYGYSYSWNYDSPSSSWRWSFRSDVRFRSAGSGTVTMGIRDGTLTPVTQTWQVTIR